MKTKKHLVILIHGINTRAYWMPRIGKTLKIHGFEAVATSYGTLSIASFLLPVGYFRRRAIRRVRQDIRNALTQHRPDKVSFIAHSFGTYVLLNLLKSNPDIIAERIILCGSVLRDTFPLEKIERQITRPILNEVGTCDYWPAFAESVTFGYGSIGSHGLNSPYIDNRWHTGFYHSDFLQEDFCRVHWVPFLRDGTQTPANQPSQVHWITRLVSWLKLKWVILGLALLAAWYFGG